MQKGHVLSEHSESKGFVPIIILIGILVLASAAGAYYFFKVKAPVQRACTQEAKICPDGTSVGRSGPNCEFTSCPSPKPTPMVDETANWKTYINKKLGFSIEYPEKELPYVIDGPYGPFFSINQEPNPHGASYLGVQVFLPGLMVDWRGPNDDVGTYIDKLISAFSVGAQSSIRRERITVAGEKAERLFGFRHTDILVTVDVYIFHKGKLYEVSLVPDDPSKYKMFDQILSTFKFID